MDIRDIKLKTLSAILSDDVFLNSLVLKGGNAIDLVYDMSSRSSIDLDFSMENDFERDIDEVRDLLERALKSEFEKSDFKTFDFKLIKKPRSIPIELEKFWGGYTLEFKIISNEDFKKHEDSLDAVRRNAIKINDQSTKFTVDFSKYEFVGGKKPTEVDGLTIYAYTPEMLAFEKLRALCQQNLKYKDFVINMTSKSRARDFIDIHTITNTYSIDVNSKDNKALCLKIFQAKKVPIEYVREIKDQFELHIQSWEKVLATLDQNKKYNDFEYYFNYTLDLFKHY